MCGLAKYSEQRERTQMRQFICATNTTIYYLTFQAKFIIIN
jgi:hypothetical protein